MELSKLNIKQPFLDILPLHNDNQFKQIVDEIITIFDDISFLSYFQNEDPTSLLDSLVKSLAMNN